MYKQVAMDRVGHQEIEPLSSLSNVHIVKFMNDLGFDNVIARQGYKENSDSSEIISIPFKAQKILDKGGLFSQIQSYLDSHIYFGGSAVLLPNPSIDQPYYNYFSNEVVNKLILDVNINSSLEIRPTKNKEILEFLDLHHEERRALSAHLFSRDYFANEATRTLTDFGFRPEDNAYNNNRINY